MAVCQTAQARIVWTPPSCNLAVPLKGPSCQALGTRVINVKAPCTINLHGRHRASPRLSGVMDRKEKEMLPGQSLKWSVQTPSFKRPWNCPGPIRSRCQSKISVSCASTSLPHLSQSESSRTEAQRVRCWSDYCTDLQSESGSNSLRKEGSTRWAGFVLEFAVGCLVAALLPATSYWIFLFRQKSTYNSQPPATAVSSVHRPISREPKHAAVFQHFGKQVALQQLSKQRERPGSDSESAEYHQSPVLLPRARVVESDLEGECAEDPAVGFALAEQEVQQLERSASGSQAGPSGHVAAPAKPSASQHKSQSLGGSQQTSDVPVSPDTAAGISIASSQTLSDVFRTRPVTWDSGAAVEPGRSVMTSASHQLPFVIPPASADPFASRAVWDTGSEPARTAFSVSAPETPAPTDSPVKLCGHSRRGSGLPFRVILRFPTKGNSFVRAAAERVGPSVVRINTERSQPSEAGGKDLFSKFFGGEDLALEDRAKDREQGQGSGFVVDGRQGIIVTNAHVINRADTVLVTFTDGRTFRGVVVGTDELTDLAVIKVDLPQWESLPKAPLGDSNSLEVGDWVVAVGNPFGLDNTVTLGIVSCLHRQAAEIGIPEKRVDFLQTDCAINPGNSGGPLLNEFGKVVGINTAIRADAEGISFAIPINYARKIVDVLSQGLPVRHAYIGVQVVTITPGLARQHNTEPGSRGVLPEVGGLLVANVADGSPAEAAGLRSGDVILEMDGRRLCSAGELQCVIAYSDVGQVIKVKTQRGQETIVLSIVAGDLTPLLSAKSGGSPRQN